VNKYYLIALGGMTGSIIRYAIKNTHLWNYNGSFPYNTLFVNITGSFILAFFLAMAFGRWNVHLDVRLGISTGFLGAYTTFSTLCKETVNLFFEGDLFWAIAYILLSIFLGLGSAYLGFATSEKIILINSKDKQQDLVVEVIEEGELE
jgi:CrcB protein